MRLMVVILAFAAMPQDDDPSADWRRFEARKGGFSVKLPAPPQESDEKTDLGSLKQTYHSLAYTDGRFLYSVVYHDNPRIPQARREGYLDDMVDGKVRS